MDDTGLPILFDPSKNSVENADEGSAVEALKLLVEKHDDPVEEAEEAKRQGNRYFSHGRPGFTKALQYYDEAIGWNSPNKEHVSVYYANRAQVQLAVGNYGKALKDAKHSLAVCPGGKVAAKAAFRAAEAALHLDRLPLARQLNEQGRGADPENGPLMKQLNRIEGRERAARKREEARRRAAAAAQADQGNRVAQLRARGVRVGRPWAANLPLDSPEEQAYVDSATDRICCRVLFLYPQFSQTDTIVCFDEQDTFAQQLQPTLPLPWDTEGDYSDITKLAIYYRQNETEPLDPSDRDPDSNEPHGWRRVQLNDTLGAVLKAHDYILPGLATFSVVLHDSPVEEKLLNDEL